MDGVFCGSKKVYAWKDYQFMQNLIFPPWEVNIFMQNLFFFLLESGKHVFNCWQHAVWTSMPPRWTLYFLNHSLVLSDNASLALLYTRVYATLLKIQSNGEQSLHLRCSLSRVLNNAAWSACLTFSAGCRVTSPLLKVLRGTTLQHILEHKEFPPGPAETFNCQCQAIMSFWYPKETCCKYSDFFGLHVGLSALI